ncbi:hypothetical protein SADUNF_Sadunf17G0094700 [Salix dunnii]|uniref:Uncharacterized protein n=1 Tax=Salix dunnii TaxID=1413687 RepID=A0A835MNI0_9ROSI|nr:hypothetical protein SADUNF_Sadunf17G0094700 [Salix dunnii]
MDTISIPLMKAYASATWGLGVNDEFSGVTCVAKRVGVMDATEVAKKGVATGCDRKRCVGPVESRVGSRIKMKANKLRSCCCDGKRVGEFGARDSCSMIRATFELMSAVQFVSFTELSEDEPQLSAMLSRGR